MATAAAAPQFPALFPTFACLLGTFSDNGVRDYSGYQVFRVNATSGRAFELIQNIFHNDGYDFWTAPSKSRPTDVLVPPGQLETLKSLLRLTGVPFDVIVQNLERYFTI